MSKLFDSLILVSLALTVLFWVAPLFDESWLSVEAIDLLGANGWGAFIPNPGFLYWPFLAYWVVVSIGLLKRINAFRTIYFSGLVVLGVASFGLGFMVLSPVEAGLYNLINLLDGAIVTLAYFTSVSNEFKVGAKRQLQPTAESGG